MKFIPAIDILGGRCVRLLKGNYNHVTDFGNLIDIAQNLEKQGAQWVHLVDLEGARDSNKRQWELIKKLRKVISSKIQWGGGIRNLKDCEELLSAGIDRILIGSMACKEPELVAEWLSKINESSRVALAIDVRWDRINQPQPYGSGWLNPSKLDISQVLSHFAPYQGLTILCTDIECDGTMQGPAIDLYEYLVTKYPHFQWIASGGVRDVQDLVTLQNSGVWAAVAGRAILEGKINYVDSVRALEENQNAC